jgi:hypothetical protein
MAVHNQEKKGIGYFVSIAVDDFVFIGGAMVTDNFGLPIEFRYTEPVRANRLQRVLYGDVLERFIHTDVILTNLLERMEQRPSLIIVNNDAFVKSVNAKGSIGVWLSETRVPRLPNTGDIQSVAADEFLAQLSDSGSPARLRTDASVTAEAQQEISGQLAELTKTMDIAEPLRRIEAAIKLIWEESPENALVPEVVGR